VSDIIQTCCCLSVFATAVSQITYEVDENAVFELPGGGWESWTPQLFSEPP